MSDRLAKNLKFLMFRNNLRAKDLSNKTNVPDSTIHRMVCGISKKPHLSSLDRIAEYFSLKPDDLLHKNIDDEPKGLLKIPIIPMANMVEAKQENLSPTSYHFVTYECLDISNRKSHYLATAIEDDSMLPLFPKGTTIILDPEKKLYDGCYAVVKLHSCQQTVFRQAMTDGQDIFLKPLNPDADRYKIKRFHQDDICFGVIVQAKLIF